MSIEITTESILTGLVEAAKADKARKAWDKLEVPIEYEGRAITLPDDPSKMPLEKAREALDRRIKDEAQLFRLIERFNAFPHDAAVAFVKAMSRLYGWASPQTVMTFFGPKPPTMLSIKTGPGEGDVVQCPLGAFKLPGIDELVYTAFGEDAKGRPEFMVHSEVKKRDKHLLVELAEETRRILKAESIYRGKAIRLGVDDSGQLNLGHPPEFLDVTDTTESSLLFDPSTEHQIETNILVPIKQTVLCQKLKIPLKRGILLEGPFGTGKSLTARMTGNVCEKNGWTFVLLDKVQGLRAALEFANRYAPAVVFAEDIDRIASDRDDDMNDLINTVDGVVSKNAKIMTVLTTNFVEKLNPVILRPGRLDAVISLRAPNAQTVERLLRHYAGNLLHRDENLTAAGIALAEQIPASIRECVERAKLGMIGRRAIKLVEQDIVTAAETMKNHLRLLNTQPKEKSAADRLAQALVEVLGGIDTDNTTILSEQVNDAKNHVIATRKAVKELHAEVNDGGLTKAVTQMNERLVHIQNTTNEIYNEVS